MSNPLETRRDIVLIVDDSPETLGFLTDALEAAEATVLVATSGPMALSIADKITPDIILLDAVMPGMDGFETCRRLKSLSALAHVPVIFMTGLTETEHVVNGLESGGVDYLTKPINLDELRARIRVHLVNARQALSARVALDAAGRHLLALSEDGTTRWSTPQAVRLLASVTGAEDGGQDFQSALRGWFIGRGAGDTAPSISVAAGTETLQLTFLGLVGPDEFLFRLTAGQAISQEQTLRAAFGLTLREAEVLLWIANGKANKDIGDILGLSPRTVNKHLEQIYVKLGVENRASAAVKASSALRVE